MAGLANYTLDLRSLPNRLTPKLKMLRLPSQWLSRSLQGARATRPISTQPTRRAPAAPLGPGKERVFVVGVGMTKFSKVSFKTIPHN